MTWWWRLAFESNHPHPTPLLFPVITSPKHYSNSNTCLRVSFWEKPTSGHPPVINWGRPVFPIRPWAPCLGGANFPLCYYKFTPWNLVLWSYCEKTDVACISLLSSDRTVPSCLLVISFLHPSLASPTTNMYILPFRSYSKADLWRPQVFLAILLVSCFFTLSP